MVFPVVVLDAVEVLVVDFEEVVLVFSLLVEDESFLLAVEEIALLLTADDTLDTCELLAFASDTTEDDTEDTEDTEDTDDSVTVFSDDMLSDESTVELISALLSDFGTNTTAAVIAVPSITTAAKIVNKVFFI